MSVREQIAANIVTTLQGITSPVAIKYVTREPFDFSKLSNAQYPAILVRSADENREDTSIGGSITQRMGTINYDLVCFVKGSLIDAARNNIIEAIEEGLDVDRTRGNKALDTQVVNIEIDEGSIDPIGGVIITVRVVYQYTRGTT
mgnify:FL=1|jgi:hypothetical protein|tara:strand:- start:18 stop:452 length:435 start_codon:yes stop_codon:yes gene_type:complete